MQPFRPFSVEEIRVHDYSRGDKGGDQQPTAAFGAPSAPAPGAGTNIFGASQPAFGASAQPFGAPASTPAFGAPASTSAFGAPASASAFGATPFGASSAPSLFGAAPQQSASGLFGAPQQSASGLFGAPQQSASGLFGAQQQSASGLFGGQPQQNPAANLFGAPASSTTLGPSSAFGATSFGASAPATQSAPSLFGGGTTTLGAFGAPAVQPATGASLFGAPNTGASLFGNTGASLFSSAPSLGTGFAASTGGLFGASTGASLFGGGAQTGFGAGFGSSFGASGPGGFGLGGTFGGQQQQQQQQQAHGPLEASLTANPFGDSKLFAGLPATSASWSSGTAASVINTAVASGQSQPKAVSVVVKAPSQPYRRTRASELLAKQNFMRRRNPGSGWFAASPMRPWGEDGSVFNVGSVLRPRTDRISAFGKPQAAAYDVTPWRTEEQRIKAANIKRLVVEPMPEDPILKPHQRRIPEQVSERPDSRSRYVARNHVETPTRLDSSIAATENPFGAFETRASAATLEANSRDTVEGEEDPRDDTEGGAMEGETDDGIEEVDAVAGDRRSGPGVDDGSEGQSSGRFVPYSEYSRQQLSSSRRRSSLGSGRTRRSPRRGLVDAPTCSDPDYYLIPSLEELSAMSNEELSHVEELTVGKKGMGEISWLEPVDLRGLDIDQVVHIKNREVSVYPLDDDIPPEGKGLNKPARIKLFGIHKLDKRTKEPLTDATTAAKMVGKLKAHCKQEGLKFLGYDVKTGTWTFQSNSF